MPGRIIDRGTDLDTGKPGHSRARLPKTVPPRVPPKGVFKIGWFLLNCFRMIGEPGGTRTRDPLLKRQML